LQVVSPQLCLFGTVPSYPGAAPTSQATVARCSLLDTYFSCSQYHMQSNYKLNCLVSGCDLSNIFQINIAPTESVSALRELIKEKKKPEFDKVDADYLKLCKANDLMPTIGC
jgi:hypothetical protein